MKSVVIVDGVRTPQGILGGALKSFTNQKLGEIVTRALLERTKVKPEQIEEVIFGCVGQASDAANVARVISLMAGIPHSVTAFTVARNCASGLQAIVSAYQMITGGEADIIIAGGAECMSMAPYVNRDLRFGKKLRHSTMIDSLWEGLTDPVCKMIMGETAENLVDEFKISRKDQDAFAMISHQRAFRATREGKFKDEIIKVIIPKKAAGKEMPPETFTEDEGINMALTEQILSQYPTIFKENGSVTPGNSCPISDGAAAVLVMSEEKAKELGLKPLGYIRSYAFAGVEPERMGIGPTCAVPKALKKAGLSLKDIQLMELNEAFAAQFIACEQVMKFDRNIANVNGGAIALGHPVGATGARITVTLLHEMKRRNLNLGLATMCVGGGQGGAIIMERK
ncbi:MAG: acetyl-CoA C-acyltransferase [Candidatus Omnitrophica bacterium CG11_big_fil_rev_8_21_14_0_20_45_26]|uniref:Acetyl-CoA C-acyltransferase n=1 Tax=Candidatus Abzuiibacterium crystallinum TaxID=1974748 RepID=A0A2H0LS45_9BACT|nr:MAG: acetyl-CoA C-acyltransferase [Candidatus Omnitrophica bacterium CG11_big_fil_rev_8_21_14_0_20_45_26]PIW64340.1 MAG: acetyl-CoA C-acyltransferase [Candidatus Omnitrophica bacterium CG12_big_fil_rev_8_21_14_0_65_45_16]